MIQQRPVVQQKIYYQFSTKNKSFLNMHYFLKDKGITNNKFFLRLLDPDLAGVDPYDPRLNTYMKQKILRECMFNYWYYIREIVRIPQQGGAVGSGIMYQLNRANLALNFCFMMNYNIYEEIPRQQGKTVAVYVRMLWEFNFGATNSSQIFINKKHEDAKRNLEDMRGLRDNLPPYLQMSEAFDFNGKRIRSKNTVETLEHVTNGNKIKTLPSARNKIAANSMGRGMTIPRIWYDEFAHMVYNKIIYLAAAPAYKTAAINAKANGAPYGIVITATPGDLTTEEGKAAYNMIQNATQWNEEYYNYTKDQLDDLMAKNENSSFMYIRYTYQQLGRDEAWFRSICIEMDKEWSAIRREILLEWSTASDNSPFRKEDLAIVKTLIKEPTQIILLKYYTFNIYEQFDPSSRYVPIIGVDVSGGLKRDYSAITIINSLTTKVMADFKCNWITTGDLARLLYELVTKYLPNAVINIERNGGFGASVISKLVNTSIKRNLFYEIKDKVVEEQVVEGSGGINRRSIRTKIYGLDETKNTREILMEILRQRMEYHKDKFISRSIYEELETLEVKRSGRIEHASNAHDDQLFSYLLALYVWYEGKDIMERWGIEKKSLSTDEEYDGSEILEQKYGNITLDIERELADDDTSNIKEQLEYLDSDKTMQYEDWMQQEYNKDQEALDKLIRNKIGRETYMKTFNVHPDDIATPRFSIPDEIYTRFNSPDDETDEDSYYQIHLH